MDVDSERAAVRWQREQALYELGGLGKCWVCGGRTAERLPDGRNRHGGCTGEGYVTKEDGSPFRAPDIPWDTPGVAPDPERRTELGVLPDWWRTMPPDRATRTARVEAVADGRRPEIDPWVLGAPDKVRAAVGKVRAAGWTVWTAALNDAGVGGRARVLMVAYRGADMIVLPWDQGVDLTWKGGAGSHWRGRVPITGKATMTALMKIMMEVAE